MFSTQILIGLLWWIDSIFTLARCHHSTLAFCDFSHCLLLKTFWFVRWIDARAAGREKQLQHVRALKIGHFQLEFWDYDRSLRTASTPLSCSPECRSHSMPPPSLTPSPAASCSQPPSSQPAQPQEKSTWQTHRRNIRPEWLIEICRISISDPNPPWKQAVTGLWPADFLLGSDAVQVQRGGHDLIVVSGTPADALMNHCRLSAPMHRSDGIFRW